MNFYASVEIIYKLLLQLVEYFHVSVSVHVLVNTFNSSTWYLKYR